MAVLHLLLEWALAFQYGLSEELNELEKSLEDVKKAQEEALAKNNIISPDFNREKFKDNLAKDPIAAAEYYFTRKDIADALAVSNKISNGEQVSENELKSLIETRTSALNILDENKLSKAVGVKNAELEEKFVNAKTKVEKETIQAELTRGTKVLEDLGRTAIGRQVINVHREDAERENQGKKTNDDELYIKKGHFIVRDIKKTEALIKKDIEEGLAAVGILHGHGKEHLIKSTVRTGNIDELKNAINVIKSKNKEAAKEEIKQEQVAIVAVATEKNILNTEENTTKKSSLGNKEDDKEVERIKDERKRSVMLETLKAKKGLGSKTPIENSNNNQISPPNDTPPIPKANSNPGIHSR